MEQAGGTGELVNAPGLGKEAVGEGHHGPEVNGGVKHLRCTASRHPLPQ